jgi:hypothetical protein
MSELSAHAVVRRESILQLAKGEARRRQRTRRALRASMLVFALLAVSFIGRLMLPHSAAPPQIAIRPLPSAPIAQKSLVRIERIETDPNITARLAIAPATPMWKRITDRELLEALADAGKPAGIIEVNGHTTLVPR